MTGVADGNCFVTDIGSGWLIGVRVEGMVMPDATRVRTVDAPSGPEPTALDVVPFLAVVPTVRVLMAESVDPPDVLRARVPLAGYCRELTPHLGRRLVLPQDKAPNCNLLSNCQCSIVYSNNGTTCPGNPQTE